MRLIGGKTYKNQKLKKIHSIYRKKYRTKFLKDMVYTKRSLGLVCLLLFTLFGKSANIGIIKESISQSCDVIKKRPLIVFLITEDPDNYKAHVTVPAFAEKLTKEHSYHTRVLLGKGAPGACEFPGMEILSETDLLVVFSRRIALPPGQMKALKEYLQKGKPLIGIRTANHAFSVMGKIKQGYEDWPEFVPEILGCKNRGYGPVAPGTDVRMVTDKKDHPILEKINVAEWHSNGNVYLVKPLLDNKATILLTGNVNDVSEPIAWTRMAGDSKIFYTSLGYPDDFETPHFNTLLVNAIEWALEQPDNKLKFHSNKF